MLDQVDLVLVMTVNPGFGGQELHPGHAREDRAGRGADRRAGRSDLEVDGGITPETAALAAATGADVLVAGSAIFRGGASAYAQNIRAIREAAQAAARRLAA